MNDSFPTHGGKESRQANLAVLRPNQKVGRFLLQEMLGQGGMGQVWKAIDPNRKDDQNTGFVVLKFLPDFLRFSPDATEEFKGAYCRVQALHHEHICPLFDIGEEPGLGCFQVMRFLEGITLRTLIRQEDRQKKGLPIRRVIELLEPIAQALDYAHRQKLIHRDIKPENIIFDPATKEVYLIDFGLAAGVRTTMSRHSQSGLEISGTEPYMSPEQWQGQLQDAASDQWALAVVAWELLTGSLPFLGDGQQLFFAVLHAALVELQEALRHLQQVLAKAMTKDRKGRFETPQAFIQALATVKHSTGAQSQDDMRRLLAQLPAPVSGQSLAAGETSAVRPALLVTPFDGHQAKAGQKAWAKHLGIGVEVTNSIGMQFRVIPPGTFDMGSPESEEQRSRYETHHRVTITQPKLLGVYPVTQGEWTKVMGSNPSYFTTVSGQDTSRFPVEEVSWDDCQEFLKRMNESHAIKGWQYRLPTEAEWEYACRAGTVEPFWFGGELNGTQANCDGNFAYQCGKGPYLQRTSVVGSYGANPFGLYDQHGNVWEWCQDWYGAYDGSVHQDPTGPPSGSSRVLRGGSWLNYALYCRSARRFIDEPVGRYFNVGLRVVCDLS